MEVIHTTMTKSSAHVLTNDWHIDSSATHHLTYHGEWFLTYFIIDLHEFIYVGDNTIQEIYNHGSVSITFINGDARLLDDAFYVPVFTQNLIYVWKMTKLSSKITFSRNESLMDLQLLCFKHYFC